MPRIGIRGIKWKESIRFENRNTNQLCVDIQIYSKGLGEYQYECCFFLINRYDSNHFPVFSLPHTYVKASFWGEEKRIVKRANEYNLKYLFARTTGI